MRVESIDWRNWAHERIQKHDKDLYEGNGKPALTVRMDRVERFCESATTRMNAVIFLLIGAIATGIVDLMVRHK